MSKVWSKSSRRWAYGALSTLALTGLVFMTAGLSATASAASKVQTITVGSGTTTGSTGLDPNSSFCAYPSNGSTSTGFTSVTVDSYYPSPTCSTGFPANPFVISAAQATSNSWGAPVAGTNWVGPNATGASNAPDAGGFIYPPGTTAPLCPAVNATTGLKTCNFYIYDATFTLKCLQKPSLKGKMKADNLAGVFLNGNFIKKQATGAGFSYDGVNPPGANFHAGTGFSTAANFVVGLNTVDFVVWDATVPSTGLDFKFVVKDGICKTGT
jgi:hypothetical protein